MSSISPCCTSERSAITGGTARGTGSVKPYAIEYKDIPVLHRHLSGKARGYFLYERNDVAAKRNAVTTSPV